MAIKSLENFNQDIEVAKEVLASMPINNAKNLSLYKSKIAELKTEYVNDRKELFNEIKRRSAKYLEMKPNSRIERVKKELLDYKDLGLYNPINTPFEKLGFDTLLYSLTHYYKNDLASVNADIKEAFAKFRAAGIVLTEKDFIYSDYAKTYIKELLKDDDEERIKDVFEDLHWKCPDVISHVETSIRILFDKNIKVFEKYVDEQQKEILGGNLTAADYALRRTNLAKELYELENYDDAVIVNKFMNGELILNEYTKVNVDKCFKKFLGENVNIGDAKSRVEDFKSLAFNLVEYKSYLNFAYVLDDFKVKYAERAGHVGECAKITKEINAIINDLVKITADINSGTTKGFLFFKKKVDTEKLYLEINQKVKDLDLKYEEYDKAFIYEKMNECITDTSSIYDVLNFAFSFKGYLRQCIKSKDDTVDIKVVKRTVNDFEKFLYNPNLNILKNIPFSVDTDLSVVLLDHYKLMNIELDLDELNVDGIDSLVKMLDIIINTHYLEAMGLDIEFINELFESKKLIEAYDKTI